MKVLMVAPVPYDGQKMKGGVEAVTKGLMQGFTHIDNVTIEIVSFQKKIKTAKTKQFSKNINVNYLPYGFIKSNKLELLFHGRRKIKLLIERVIPDVIHIQGNGSNYLLTIGLKKKNLIVTEHGVIREELKHVSSLRSKLNLLVVLSIEKILNKSSINKIFISKYNMLLSSNKLNKIGHHELIYNPIDSAFFCEKSIANLNREKLIYIGSIIKRKGLIDLLQVIVKLNKFGIKFRLDVVGGFCEELYKKEILGFVSKNNLGESIKFHGWLDSKEILELFKEIPTLVLPSYQETLPIVIAEAMASSRLIVATKIAGIPEMIENGSSGFLYRKGNLRELYKILLNIYYNYQSLIYCSNNAHKRALEMFSSISVAQKTLRFYRKVINDY